MRGFFRENRIPLLLLLAGLVCAAVICAQRMGLEARNGELCVVMTAEDAALIDGLPDTVRIFDGGATLDGSVLLIEDENQYSHLPVQGYGPDTVWGAGETSAVRCFRLIEKYAARYASLGYDGAQEIENILYRAVTDRNIRVIWLTPFTDGASGNIITEGAVYAELLDSLALRVARHGIALGDGFSVFPAYEPPRALYCAALLCIFGAWAPELAYAAGGKKPFKIAAYALSALLFAAGFFSTAIAALLAAVGFPCLALCFAVSTLAEHKPERLSGKLCGFYAALGAAFAVSLAGGICVAALQSSTGYLLAAENFRGVKLSQALPLVFAAYTVFARLYGSDGARELARGRRTWIFAAVIVLIAAAVLFLMRTGDGILPVGTLEQRLRNWLEHLLIARPRTKEFLVAWPCLAVAFALVGRGSKAYAFPFAIISAAGMSSDVNTFCHSRAPVWLSLTRSLLGAVIGLAIGTLLICVIDAIAPRKDLN